MRQDNLPISIDSSKSVVAAHQLSVMQVQSSSMNPNIDNDLLIPTKKPKILPHQLTTLQVQSSSVNPNVLDNSDIIFNVKSLKDPEVKKSANNEAVNDTSVDDAYVNDPYVNDAYINEAYVNT